MTARVGWSPHLSRARESPTTDMNDGGNSVADMSAARSYSTVVTDDDAGG